jgi:hypothetical protein
MDVINFKGIDKGCLKAKFDVVIPEWGLTIREVTLFEKDGKEWLGMPSRQYEKDGKQKSYDLVSLEKGKRQRFDAACIAKVKAGQYQTKQEKQSSDDTPF